MSADDDIYGQVIAMPWMAARAKAVSSSEADPEQAARAMELSEATGVNVGSIYANTEEFQKAHKQALTGQIINDNKHLANYVNSHPLAADISSDDWGQLDTFSKTLDRYSAGFSLPKKFFSSMADVWRESRDTATPEGSAKALGIGVPKGLISLPIQTPSGMGADQLITAFENLNKATGFAPSLPDHIPRASEVLQQTIENITGPWYKPKNPFEEMLQTVGEFAPFVAAPSGEAKIAERFLKNVVMPALGSDFGKRWAEKAGYPELGEAAGMVGMLAGGALGHGMDFSKGKGKVEKPPQENKELTRAMTAAEPFISAGEEPPPYLHPEIDKMKADQAKEDSKALDEALTEAASSTTRGRNPKLFADFTRQQVQGEIGIPFDALGDLYGTKEIHPEDGLLGWVPDIIAKVRAAAATGGDIKVPIADWLAHVEPEVAKELKDDIRFRDGGFTLNEVSEAPKVHAMIEADGLPKVSPAKFEERTMEPTGQRMWDTGTKEVTIDGEVVSKAELQRKPNGDIIILKIETEDNARRQGHATALVDDLFREFPNAKIETTLRTDDGSKLFGNYGFNADGSLKRPTPDGQAVKSVRGMAGLEKDKWVEDMRAEMPHIFDIDLESPKEFLANDFDGKVMSVMSKGTSTVAEMAGEVPYGLVSGQLYRFNQLIKDTVNKFAGDTKVHIVDDKFFNDELGYKDYNGYYDVQNHVIVIPESTYYSGNFRQIFLHETIHAATSRVLEARPELQDRISGVMLAIHDINPELKDTYGFTDEHEFLAEAFSNKNFQAELAKIALPKEVGERLGLTGKLHTAWDAVVDFVRKALGIPEEEISALEVAVRFFSEAAESELTKKDYGRLKRRKMLPQPSKASEREDNLPAPKEGSIRFYHGIPPEGGQGPETGGGRWVNQNFQYARDYRSEGGKPGKAYYVDIPHEWLDKKFPDVEIYRPEDGITHTPYPSFEVPEEWAQKMKPVPDKLQEPVKTPSKAPDAGEGTQPELPGTTRQEDLPPFTPQSMGMTKPQFAKYIALIKRLDKEDQAYQLEKALEAERKRQTPEWKAAEKEVTNDVRQGLSDNQHLNAWNFLTTGFVDGEKTRKVRLDAEKLTDEQKARLPKDFVGKGGIDPDDAASMLGYDSGGKLVERMALLNEAKGDLTIEKFRDQLVKQQVADVMKRQFGELDENILESAKDHVISPTQIDMLHEKTVAAAVLAGHEIPFSKAETKSWAQDEFSRLPANEVSKDRFLKESGKAEKLKELAILNSHLRGEDPESILEAFKQQQRQYHANLLAAEAKKFAKEKERAERMIDRYSARASFKSVDQQFTDHAHELLMRVGAPNVRRTPENLALSLKGENFDQFATRINNAGGGVFDPQSPPGTKLEDFTVDEYRDFAKALKSLDFSGRKAKKIEVAWKELEHQDVVQGIEENLDELAKKGFDPTKRGFVGGTRRVGRNIDARLIKMEQLADWIDHNDPRGWFNQSVVRPLYHAQGQKGDAIAAIAEDIKKIAVDRKWGKALPDKVDNQILKNEDGSLAQLTNENKIAVALNWGNESNRSVLARGMGWKPPEVQVFLDMHMTDMDWEFVKGVWNTLGTRVAPLVEEATTKRSGVPIEMVQPVDVQAMGKTISGGYYPLLKDPRAVLLGEEKETELVNKPMFSPLPMARALKLRTGIAYPIDLSLNALNGVINETLHASIFQDPVANARKVITDPSVKKGIDKAFGPEYVTQMKRWLDDIANNGGERYDDLTSWVSRNARENVVYGLMGYKLSTAAIHGMSAGTSSVYEVGALRLSRAVKDLGLAQFLPDVSRRMFSNPDKTFETVDWAHQTFPELRNRMRDIGRDMQAQLQKLVSTGFGDDLSRIRAANIAWSMKLVATLDQLTATPTAIAAYTKAITEGLSHEDAVYAGEKAVRTAHGSPSLVGRANIGRGELGKWATIAYNGYWNHNYNRFRSAVRDIKAPDIDFSDRLWLGSAAMAALIVAPALAHYAVRGNENSNYTGALAEAIGSQFGGQVPIVNGLTYSFMHGRDPHLSPFDEVFKGAMNVMKDVKQMANGQKAEKFVKHAATAPGFLLGIGASDQVGTAMQFIRDVVKDKERPKTMMEWARGLITGHTKVPEKRK